MHDVERLIVITQGLVPRKGGDYTLRCQPHWALQLSHVSFLVWTTTFSTTMLDGRFGRVIRPTPATVVQSFMEMLPWETEKC